MRSKFALSFTLAFLIVAPVISSQGTSSVKPQPVGIQASRPDSARDTTVVPVVKQYHGERWFLIGGAVGGVILGGAAAYVSPLCDSRSCATKLITGAAGVGFIVVGFVTGFIYGLFNG